MYLLSGRSIILLGIKDQLLNRYPHITRDQQRLELLKVQAAVFVAVVTARLQWVE